MMKGISLWAIAFFLRMLPVAFAFCPAFHLNVGTVKGRFCKFSLRQQKYEGYGNEDDMFSDIQADLSSIQTFVNENSQAFDLVWDGHDAFVSERFRCSTAQVSSHVIRMMDTRSEGQIRELLTNFGEEPAEGMDITMMGERLLKLAFLSTGLRQLLEDDILQTNTKMDSIGLLVDDIEPEGMMRSEVRRKQPLTPNARSTPKLREGVTGERLEEGLLRKKTVVQLREECREQGMAVSGNKAKLIERLLLRQQMNE